MALVINESVLKEGIFEAIRARLESEIRARLEPIAEQAVDEAVAATMKALEVEVQSYYDNAAPGRIVEVLLKDKRDKAA